LSQPNPSTGNIRQTPAFYHGRVSGSLIRGPSPLDKLPQAANYAVGKRHIIMTDHQGTPPSGLLDVEQGCSFRRAGIIAFAWDVDPRCGCSGYDVPIAHVRNDSRGRNRIRRHGKAGMKLPHGSPEDKHWPKFLHFVAAGWSCVSLMPTCCSNGAGASTGARYPRQAPSRANLEH
jgi:hypothetical protein